MPEADHTDWRDEATRLQCNFASRFCHPNLIDEPNLYNLKKQVAYATCGKPPLKPSKANEFLGYTKDALNEINNICNQIINKSGSFPFKFNKTIVILRKENKNGSYSCCPTTVFRIETEDGNIFIDNQARVYKNWQHYTETNVLPVAEYCYPVDGVYTNFGPHRKPVIFSETPSSGVLSQAVDKTDTIMAVGGVVGGAAAIAVAAAPMTPVLAVSGAYGCARAIWTLRDRKKHEQPWDLGDEEARKSWYNVTTAVLAGLNAATAKCAQKAVEGGKSVPKALKYFSRTTAVASVAISGFGFGGTLYMCWDKKKKNRLTKYDIFCLVSESLFFYNAIVSLNKAWNLGDSAAAPDEAGHVGDASSGAIQLSTYELLRTCPPGVADVVFRCDNIAHDAHCWQRGEIGLLSFLNNTADNLKYLYDNCFPIICEILKKVWNWIRQLGRAFGRIYRDTVESTRRVFGCKVSNLENELNEAKQEANDSISKVAESVDENADDARCDEGEEALKKETQDVLTVVVNLIDQSVFSADDMQEFNNILDAVKCHVILEFKAKIKQYSNGLKAHKELSGDKFDATSYNEKIGFKGNPADYFFKETIEEAMTDRGIYMIGSKMEKLRKELPNNITQVWQGLAEGMFYYSFSINQTHASLKTQLIGIIEKIIQTSLSEEMIEVHDHGDFIMVKLLDDKDITINIYNQMLSEHTANGMIMIVQ